MRVIIAGSRGITDAARLNRAILASQFDITHVISGACEDSPDELGAAWARLQEPKVPVVEMRADWGGLGKRAGMVRNCAMAKDADALIALWDGKSPGTRHMINEAVGKGLYHYICATCNVCGGYERVALYRFVTHEMDQLRAACRDCLVKRGGDITFFDWFNTWGNHTLHTTEKRYKPAESRTPLQVPPHTEVPVPKFGQKAEAVQQYKKWKQLKQETGQLTL